MLFRTRDLEAIMAGHVTTAFRRWRKVGAKAGSQIRTQLGMLTIDSVEVVDPATLTEADAKAANYPSLAALREMFESQEGTCYRIGLHPGGDDPREALRATTDFTDKDLGKINKLGDWAVPTLKLIDKHPGVVSTKLAAAIGQERFAFKDNVSKLKALGLTISLETGYRLSPRGEAYLKRFG
jgi:hypothetical protein